MQKKFLIIQTAFIGDVILATALVEKLSAVFPDARIDFLLRKGNETLLQDHPKINTVIIRDKGKNKFSQLLRLIKQIRKTHYDYVINVHRFFSSGLITGFSGAKHKIGFKKNPVSFLFTKKVSHELKKGVHEIDRNQKLIEHLCGTAAAKPKLYPRKKDHEPMAQYIQTSFVCIAPASVWFTKQLPFNQWLELIQQLPKNLKIYLIGGNADIKFCEKLVKASNNENVINLAGKLPFLASAALMSKAEMNYVNDSAPLHIASAMNAPVTAFFCSTVTDFGFYPLSDNRTIAEINYALECRPCGLHGFASCPKKHFKCGNDIDVNKLVIKNLTSK